MLSNRTRSHGSSLDMLFANMSEDVQTTIVPSASPGPNLELEVTK